MNNNMDTNIPNAPVVQTLKDFMPEPIIDKVSDSLTYMGYAPLGVQESQVGWRIARITVTGTVTKTEYAQGSMGYDFSWTNRASYNYGR